MVNARISWPHLDRKREMHEKGVQVQVHIAMALNPYLTDETQQGFLPEPGSRSPMLALLIKLRQLRIAIALLGRQIYGVGIFPQNLSKTGLKVAVHGCQLCKPTRR